jgi:hypothetical protein
VVNLTRFAEPFCPVAAFGGSYHEDICTRAGCEICRPLLQPKGGTA